MTPLIASITALLLCIVLVGVLFVGRISQILRVVLTLAMVLTILEIGLFENRWFWRASSLILRPEHVGFKQKGMIRAEIVRREAPWNARHLAIGSSQVSAIFQAEPAHAKDIRVFHTAGMVPVELFLYRDIVKRHCTDTVLLYLCELDLAHSSTVEGFKLAPTHNVRDLVDISTLVASKSGASPSDICELWITNFVSLYQSNFLFRGLLKRITGETSVFGTVVVEHEVPQDRLQGYIEAISAVNDEWFETNIQAVDRFLIWCGENDLDVIVIEADYHPRARALNEKLRQKGHALLAEACARHPHTQFWSNEELGVFAAEDYRDGSHVRQQAGARFTQMIIERLDAR